jgi:thiol-disulfide isomerase/thioredoxin
VLHAAAFYLLLAWPLPAAPLPIHTPGPAPAFQVRALDGRVWTQPGLGKGCVLVDFWASWCQPCLQEIPALNALQAKYGPSGRLAVLGLSLDKGGEPAVRAAAQRLGVAYAVAPVDGKVAEAYGVKGFPSAVLLRGGRVALVLEGRRSLAGFEAELGPYLR